LLRFLTCGSVDDGKSTLIGRLFYDAKMIYEDTLRTLERDSAIHGTTGGGFDPALFTDGLKAEREQGITIDVAYRYFSTANASSSSRTRRATSSTRGTWRPALRPATWP
jgi:bifunctional enzyme CysN/CysC